MADGFSIKVKGKQALFSKLKRLAPAVEKELSTANAKSAEEMAAMARRFAPVDTGALRDSIVATPGGQETPPYSQPGGSTAWEPRSSRSARPGRRSTWRSPAGRRTAGAGSRT